jgi:hypothetical protein
VLTLACGQRMHTWQPDPNSGAGRCNSATHALDMRPRAGRTNRAGLPRECLSGRRQFYVIDAPVAQLDRAPDYGSGG